MRISDWSSDVCSSDLKAEVQRKYQAIVGLANRVRVGNDWNYRNVMFCDDPGGTFQIPFDVLGRHRPTVNDLPIDVPSVADDAQGEGNFARSEEHTSELQSLMRISSAFFCLKNKI